MKIPFAKAHGTGNDFILLLAEDCIGVEINELLIRTLCARRTGIGADSLLLLSPAENYDFRMDYYNSDGSWETMCANGARCAARYMNQLGKTGSNISFITGDGDHEAEILSNNSVRLKMITPDYKSEMVRICDFNGRHVDSGAAHFVTEVSAIDPDLAAAAAPKIRYADDFQPRGINVNFYQKQAQDHIQVLTYEKGIEALMLSCGSGAVAAAYDAVRRHSLTSPLRISVPGGELQLDFDPLWQEVWLSGPAVILFQSEIDLDQLL